LFGTNEKSLQVNKLKDALEKINSKKTVIDEDGREEEAGMQVEGLKKLIEITKDGSQSSKAEIEKVKKEIVDMAKTQAEKNDFDIY
jgi:uncharacterized protein YcbK (DUF882 family)